MELGSARDFFKTPQGALARVITYFADSLFAGNGG
jgi:hypothetical protein